MVTPPVLNYPFSTVPVSPSSRLPVFPSSRLNPSYPSFSSIKVFFPPIFLLFLGDGALFFFHQVFFPLIFPEKPFAGEGLFSLNFSGNSGQGQGARRAGCLPRRV